MRILITGGAGFIGSHLAKWHINKKDDVIVVDDLSGGKTSNLGNLCNDPQFKLYQADVINWPELNYYINWADRIYHMAALVGVLKVIAEPINVLYVNITSCERLLKAVAQSHSKPIVIIASSSSVYGHSTKRVFSEKNDLIIKNVNQSISTYSVSKLACEEFAWAYLKQYEVPQITVRLFNIIGPNQSSRYGSVVPRFIQQATEQQDMTVFGNGKQKRSFCDIRDAISALDLLANNPKAVGEIVNVGSDKEISINELALLIRKHANSQSKIVHIPYEEIYHKDFVDISHRKPDLRKLYSLTHFNQQWKLEHTIDLLLARQNKALTV